MNKENSENQLPVHNISKYEEAKLNKGSSRSKLGSLLIKASPFLLSAGLLTQAATAQSVKDSVENVLYQEEIKRDNMAYIALLHMRYGLYVGLPQADDEVASCREIDRLNMLKWTIDVLHLFPDEMIRGKLMFVELGRQTFGNHLGIGDRHQIQINLGDKFPRIMEETAFKAVMLHELQHFFDGPELVEEEAKSFPEWKKLNPEGTVYDMREGASASYPFFSESGKPDGFVFGYQQKNAAEDRAVVAQILFSPECVQSWARGQDPYMAGKIEAMKTFYYDLSQGKMDANYWKNYQQGAVDNSYWLNK